MSIRLPSFYTSKGRIFSSYLRPWVLHAKDSSPHVPLLKDIDIMISDELVAFEAEKKKESEIIGEKRRLRGKQACPPIYSEKVRYVYTTANGEPLPRSYADAWKDYRTKHVVSRWASRIILQFNASHLADSLEAMEAEQADDNKRERNPIDTSWMQLTAVRDVLQGNTSTERRRKGDDANSKLSAHAHLVEEAKSISEKLWSLPRTMDVPVDVSNKHKSIGSTKLDKPEKRKAEAPQENSNDRAKKAGLVYRGFSNEKAKAWLKDLERPAAKKKIPSAEQLACLREVIARCRDEAKESNENQQFRSEPLRMILHGVPGAVLNASRIRPL